MTTNRNWKIIGGWVLHGLIAGMMILAGSAKVFGLFPPEEVAKTGPGPSHPSDRCRRTGQRHFAAHSAHLITGTAAYERILGRRHLSPHVEGRAVRIQSASCSSPGSAAISEFREHSAAFSSGVKPSESEDAGKPLVV